MRVFDFIPKNSDKILNVLKGFAVNRLPRHEKTPAAPVIQHDITGGCR
jgi:hypothetical protein